MISVFPPRSRMHAFLGLAVLLTTVPVWTLPLGILGPRGFAAYLSISDAYYRLPQRVFGGAHFSRREFGTIPTSGAAYALAAVFYVGLALASCWLVPVQDARGSTGR